MNIKTGELISQIRSQTKSVHQDNLYISDRLVFSLIKKHLALFLYREDGKMKVSAMQFLYSVLPFLELKEVDKVEAQCTGIKTHCTIKRTHDKLPSIFKGYYGPLIGRVSSIDASQEVQPTTAIQYLQKMNASDSRYNKTLYYWYLNGYLYFPNIEWDAVRVEAILEQEVDSCGDVNECQDMQDMEIGLPPYLISTIQAEVLKDLLVIIQTPTDQTQDKMSNTR